MGKLESFIITNMDKINRFSIFFVFFYFGILKLLGLSAVEALVTQLHDLAIPSIPIDLFVIFLGAVEVIIGLLFLLPKYTKLAVLIFACQISTTLLPLFVLPQTTWLSFGVPTLVGQYILKNIVLIAMVMNISKNYTESIQ